MSIFKKGIYISPAQNFASRLHFYKLDKRNENPFFRILYRTESGRIGFDADCDGEEFLKWMLSNAWAWDRETEKMKRFVIDKSDSSQNPYFFLSALGVKREFTQRITYHNPNENLKSLFDDVEAYHAQTEQYDKKHEPLISKLPLIAELETVCQKLLIFINDCDMIGIWLMAQVEAILLVRDFSSFKLRLIERCQQKNISAIFVDGEDKLPQW